eukprot:c7677_g1_i1 orf=110-1198(+)
MEGIVEHHPSCLEGTELKVGDFVWAENGRTSSSSSSCAELSSNGELAGTGKEEEEEAFPAVDLSLSDEELVPIIHSAAVSWGFFRIFNHGVPQALLDSIASHSLRFFDLPLSDKLAVTRNPPSLPVGYTGLAKSSTIKAWSEALHVMPGEERISSFLERLPSLQDRHSFSSDLIEYFNLLGALVARIVRLLFHGLHVDADEISRIFNSIDSSSIRINHYPACPVADLTYGSPPHKDYGGLAILHQDDVGGLEVLKDGKWVAVKPEKGYLIANIGDLIQMLSNGSYKSILHRSMVKSSERRLSFVFFYFPTDETWIVPISKLVTKESPAKYKSFYMKEYHSMFGKAQLANHSPSVFFEEALNL